VSALTNVKKPAPTFATDVAASATPITKCVENSKKRIFLLKIANK
jgi:hypothetical protein